MFSKSSVECWRQPLIYSLILFTKLLCEVSRARVTMILILWKTKWRQWRKKVFIYIPFAESFVSREQVSSLLKTIVFVKRQIRKSQEGSYNFSTTLIWIGPPQCLFSLPPVVFLYHLVQCRHIYLLVSFAQFLHTVNSVKASMVCFYYMLGIPACHMVGAQ